jgi:hypothetical protein
MNTKIAPAVRSLLVLGVVLMLALVATCWLGAYLPEQWSGACVMQAFVFCFGAVACFFVAAVLATKEPTP